jgi:hypothetical protein
MESAGRLLGFPVDKHHIQNWSFLNWCHPLFERFQSVQAFCSFLILKRCHRAMLVAAPQNASERAVAGVTFKESVRLCHALS